MFSKIIPPPQVRLEMIKIYDNLCRDNFFFVIREKKNFPREIPWLIK